MNKVQLIMLGACAVFSAGTASAADLGYKDRYETPVLLWQGLYAGVHVGGIVDGEAEFDWEPGEAITNDTNTVDLSGLLAGGHLGYNLQFGKVVVGIEGDAAFAKTDDASSCVYVGGRCESFINTLYSARGRLGVTLRDNLLFYGTGGLAIANVEHTNDNGGEVFQDQGTVDGVVYGGGIEYMHSSGVTVGIELLHYDFETEAFSIENDLGGAVDLNVDLDTTIVKGRVGFHFN